MKFYKSFVGRCFILFAIIPLLLVGIIVTYVSTKTVYNVKVSDTKERLKGAAKELVYSYELLAQGQSGFEKIDNILYAGDYVITGDYSIVDRLKSYTGIDMSLFYKDTRVVTTLLNRNGGRYVNTTNSEVWNNYGCYGKEYFDEAIVIDGTEYFGYYVPVTSDQGEFIGMGFAGIPSNDIRQTIRRLNVVTIVVCCVLCVACLILCILVTNRLLNMQNSLMSYLEEIDSGDFDHSMSNDLCKRKDEYGIMSRYFVKLNDSLQSLIQRDGLTGLYNRRAAVKNLEGYIAAANTADGKSFTVAMGDIDFFKRVNDTYGHNCGDEILKMVSSIIGDISYEEGFAARWGGEEFIIVYKSDKDSALKKLEAIVDRIRSTAIVYDKNTVNVTMTFGLSEYIPPRELDWVISNADALLYKGKESGRNRIVV